MRELKEIKLFWATDIKRNEGNQFGYYVHNKMLREASEKHIQLVDKDFTDAIYILSPEFFKEKIPGVNTWIFTMFEGTTIPAIYQKQLQKADYLLAPSTWVKALFDKYFPPEKSFVVPHGVSRKFLFKKRVIPQRKPFRFLWVGAPNPRKGYEEVAVVWDAIFKNEPRVELYMKTTLVPGLERKRNVILDGRKLSEKELVDLYLSAHCFLFPTRGEGFGLTLAEAMRTGCPCIATPYSGVTDFFDERVGFPLEYKMGKGKIKFVGDDHEEETEIAYPDPNDLARQMIRVLENYKEASERGERAYRRMLTVNWNNSARRLADVLCGVPASL